MINANELRLGNFINYQNDNTIFRVISIDTNGVGIENERESSWIECSEFSGIQLTDEILLKCGFEKNTDLKTGTVSYSHNDCFYDVEKHGDKYPFVIHDYENGIKHYLFHDVYLHDLQNSFQRLNKKELEINF